MGEMRKVTVELGDETVELIDSVVAEGRFTGAADVLRFAMTLFAEWERDNEESYHDLVDRVGLDRLREMIEEGFASGDAVEDSDELFESVKRRGRERLLQARAAE